MTNTGRVGPREIRLYVHASPKYGGNASFSDLAVALGREFRDRHPRMPAAAPGSRLIQRLLVAFAAPFVLYVGLVGVALFGLDEVRKGLEQTAVRVEGLRLALELSSAARDQYAHVAHTIIIGNTSHLGMYGEALSRTSELLQSLDTATESPDERAWVKEIRAALQELDSTFVDRVIPAVIESDSAKAREEHHHILEDMQRVSDFSSRLAIRGSESVASVQTTAAQLQQSVFTRIILFLLLAPALAAWASVIIWRSVARPVATLQLGAKDIADGKLDTRIELGSDDELGALAESFNTMAAAIRRHQDERIQIERLAGIGRLAAGVAHEINNPLGVILGYTKLLGRKATGALADDLSVIESEVLRCKEIVDGLLDLARTAEPTGSIVDLNEVLADVLSGLQVASQDRLPKIDVSGENLEVRGDPNKLRQVLLNLLKNAIDAAGPAGSIIVSTKEDAPDILLTVEDSGPGFSSAARERLFEPFFTTKPKGTGLGLAVSQSIARAHGGRLEVGEGSKVTLRLPKAKQDKT